MGISRRSKPPFHHWVVEGRTSRVTSPSETSEPLSREWMNMVIEAEKEELDQRVQGRELSDRTFRIFSCIRRRNHRTWSCCSCSCPSSLSYSSIPAHPCYDRRTRTGRYACHYPINKVRRSFHSDYPITSLFSLGRFRQLTRASSDDQLDYLPNKSIH